MSLRRGAGVGGKAPRLRFEAPHKQQQSGVTSMADRSQMALLDREYALLVGKEATDCTVSCQGEIFRLHKVKFFRHGPLEKMFYGDFQEARAGHVNLADALDLVIPLVYFLYVEQYLTDRFIWEKLVSHMCPGAKLPYRGDDYAYHAGMYELGERYDLGGLRRSAYESFVRCAFGADIAVPLSESEPPPSPGIEEDRDSEQDIDTETEQLTDKAPSREATVTPSQARIPKIRTIVTTIMRDDRFQHLKPLRDVLVHLLLQIRKDEHRPPGELDSSYLMMTSHLLFARLEKLGTWCSASAKRLRWDT
ncbi:hypothetical protein LTR24_004483 [Lithohypha guttulata]|uniref:BTB domain-containing protein n=1 Tax=Lithohypha guttulata TaxID=1690604 RepID=A0ABR0KBU9_9EURO|nr:hypothetical protein LTR24_004483 [Lithohypha guttulata]